jgi:hypothetical protein
MKKLVGIIKPDGYVETADGRRFKLPFRGKDNLGFPEVLIDATSIGLSGSFKRQSVVTLIGKKCKFVLSPNGEMGYNFEVISEN